jgi:hypothetical protein
VITDHAPLPPSSAHVWVPCPGSVAYQAAYPAPEDSPEAREGTAAHWYATELLQGRDVPVGAVAPNGHPVDAEMVDCAQDFLIDVRDTMKAHPGATLHVEQLVHMPIVHAGNYGTPDVRIVDRPQKFLAVTDYKYGHRFVDAVGNYQLADYAIGGLTAEGIPCADWPNWTVALTIAQPRNYHRLGPIREWITNGGILLNEYVPLFFEAAAKAMQPDAPLQTGEHCRDCSARHVCPALQQAGFIAMDVALQSQPLQLPPHAVGLELRQIEDAIARLTARQTGLQEHALGLIRGGTLVPFYTTQYASGRERWTVPAQEVFALGDLMGVEVRKAPEPITPAQARKAGIDATVIRAYAEKPQGALRLERVDDNAAKLAFQ